jgi:CRP/FNR family transcriptional regulator, cyclic AMP receptor protein
MNSPYGLPADCHSCHLQPDNFFCALSREAIARFDQIKHATVLPEGAVIFTEGQAPRGIFMLCQGQAKLSTGSREGKTFIVRMLKPGEVLGLHEVVTTNPYELTAETTQPSQLSFVSREDFIRFVKEHGDALLRTAQHISRDCQEAYEVARTMGLSHSATWRIAKFLLASATEGKVANGVLRAKLGMTHEQMAQVVGTSRETITRILADLRKRDIVELRGSTLIIHNKTALEQLLAA